MTPEEALAVAIRIVGGKKSLAASITALDPENPCSPQAISQWPKCPADRVQIVLEAMAAARETPPPTAHDLRPDIYPLPKHRADGRTAMGAYRKAAKAKPKEN